MILSSLKLTDFRNYPSLSLSLPPQGALFVGLNGSGKTNILEGVHALCLGRSQRGARRQDMIRTGSDVCCIEGVFGADGSEAPGAVTATIGFSRDRQVSMTLDGRRLTSMRQWFGHAALVSFGPADLELVTGNPGVRRRFLDMLICQIDPEYLERLLGYQKALLNRNRLLSAGGDETLMDLYESDMAAHGAYLYKVRSEIVAFCQPFLSGFYAEISGGREAGSMVFRPGFNDPEIGVSDWGDVFSNILKNKRKQDFRMGYSTTGPHRDDILFQLDGKPAKQYASQGQCRTLALSARMSSVRCLQEHKNEAMIFLVDDAFSELDDLRTSYVYPLLKGAGQLFMTTPSEHFPAQVDLPQYRVAGGTVVPR